MLELNKIHQGDCLELMKKLEDNSVDAIVTDSPYGLEFMGKDWDKFGSGKNIAGGTTGKDTPFGRSKPLNSVYQYGLKEKNQFQEFCYLWAKECLRVLKPGGFLLSFGGTRTYHRMVCGIEDAGFEIRDTISYLYGSGFPKSHNIGKSIDKLQGNEREVVGKNREGRKTDGGYHKDFGADTDITKGNSEWEGWGTSLKPAQELICVARKPLSEKNVALNVLKWGTGGINIDACRVGNEQIEKGRVNRQECESNSFGDKLMGTEKQMQQGRFPANLILDEEAGKLLDEQSGNCGGGNHTYRRPKPKGRAGQIYGAYEQSEQGKSIGFKDKGGASRYFKNIKNSNDTFINDTYLLFLCQNKKLGDISESQMVDGIVNGVKKEIEKLECNWNIDGFGNNLTEKYLKDSIYIIKTLTKQIIESKIYNLYPLKNIDFYTQEIERITKSLKELNIENVKNVKNINNFQSSLKELLEHIMDIVSPALRNILENGERKTENIGTNTIENTEQNLRFKYTPKASKSERNLGCEELEAKEQKITNQYEMPREDGSIREIPPPRKNNHPTVKSLGIMEYLIKLVSKENAVILDPFMGSGTTGIACIKLNRKFIGIEKEEEYCKIANARIKPFLSQETLK